ncbi:MAG TPA: LptF/LptG family permease, partial [Longimicrobiales bacterium]|nr:LptF/LptG family permease [Longimicrobiales bacterium]
MGILTRYLLRAHLGPFFFAFTALTGLLFLNAIAQRLEALVGRGLEWSVILEFAVLSLPHTVALTLPMAVLVAVLYAFGDLAANNEVTAMSAGGVQPSRILLPMVAAGALVTAGMLYFNDRVLPEANHSLKNLLVDIGNKSPTFELKEQVVNEVRAEDGRSRYYLQAARIDRQRSELYDVTIYDVSDPTRHRTTYADSGTMAFNELGTDLYLTLHDGVIYEAGGNRVGGFTRVTFEEQVVPLRGVGDILERRTGGDQRSDREMSIAMLASSAREKEAEAREASEELRTRSLEAVREALGREPGAGEEGTDGGRAGATLSRRATSALPRDDLTESVALVARTKASQERSLRLTASRYRVEIHKKYTISFACIVFVLIGAPIAVRFPRGGVGMTIAVSVGVFAIYWMGLIGGERLADRGIVDPALSMWTPNILFFLAGLAMSMRLGRWVATARGGGWDDLLFTLKRFLAGPLRRLR